MDLWIVQISLMKLIVKALFLVHRILAMSLLLVSLLELFLRSACLKNTFSELDGKVKMYVSLTLESILDLDQVKSLMKLQIKVQVKWMDARLEYQNLDKEVNTINLEQKETLWTPIFIFDNTNDKVEASFFDDSSNGRVLINSKAKSFVAPLQVLNNFQKYSGSDG